MWRRWLVVPVLGAAMMASVADLDACGDKFLRIGRSARFPGYAAVYPAAILIYKPASATSAGIRELAALLKRAGHRPAVVESGSVVDRASAASFDVVIATYADAARLREDLRTIPSRPDVLPILLDPSREVAAEAHRQFD